MEHEFHPMWSLAWNVAQATAWKLEIGGGFLCDPGQATHFSVPQSPRCEVETVTSISTRAGGIVEIAVL